MKPDSTHSQRAVRGGLWLTLITIAAFVCGPITSVRAAADVETTDVETTDDSSTQQSTPSPVTLDGGRSDADRVSYIDVLDALRDGLISEASFDPQSNVVRVTLVDGAVLESNYPSAQAPALVVSMLDSGVRLSSLPAPGYAALPYGAEALPVAADPESDPSDSSPSFIRRYGVLVLPLMFLGFFVLIWRGRRKEKREAAAVEAAVPVHHTTFADVAGCEEAIDDLREFVEFLKNPERFERLGAKIPRGALLVGPPGTGKTLLARAVAGEAGVAFHHAAGSDFVELYVGVGAQRVRELFAKARQSERAIVFIDEIDAIGRVRSSSPGTTSGGHIEQENTLIALLNELDGFTQSGVVVLAATNRADILDPALTRPGRLERKVHVPNPDRRGREYILQVHTANKPLADDVDLGRVARRTTGMSGADLAHIANEAAIEAARQDLDVIPHACFDDAIATVMMGRPRHSAVVTDADRRITAWHEAGHALVALLEPDADDPVAVSIVPRGPAGGVTWLNGSDDQYLSRQAARARLAVALGGRAGEELLLDGEFTQGAQSDLLNATELAGQMVTRFGMTRRGLMIRNLDEDSADVVEELLEEAMQRVRALLTQHHTQLERLAEALLAHDTLSGEDIARAIDGAPLVGARRSQPVARVMAARTAIRPERFEPEPGPQPGPARALRDRLLRRRSSRARLS